MLAASLGLFFGYIDSGYEEVKVLRAEAARYDEALAKSEELKRLRDELNTKYHALSLEDLDKLWAILPDHMDNVRLALNLDTIAASHRMIIRNLELSENENPEDGLVTTEEEGGVRPLSLGTANLTFEAEGRYTDLIAMLKDLERNLRIIDITTLNFATSEDDKQTYKVGVKIYWLKS